LLAYLLVLGWWSQPQDGPRALARFAGSLRLTLSKQEMDCHFTALTAQWLLVLLRRAIQVVVCAKGVSIPLLQQFTAVLVEDSRTISLPSALETVWQGCGGSRSHTHGDGQQCGGLKITARFDLLRG